MKSELASEAAAVKCGLCSQETSVMSVRGWHGMTREKGKRESRKERLLYKDHKRKTVGCKHLFTVKSSWVWKRKSTRLLVTLRQNEGCPSRQTRGAVDLSFCCC